MHLLEFLMMFIVSVVLDKAFGAKLARNFDRIYGRAPSNVSSMSFNKMTRENRFNQSLLTANGLLFRSHNTPNASAFSGTRNISHTALVEVGSGTGIMIKSSSTRGNQHDAYDNQSEHNKSAIRNTMARPLNGKVLIKNYDYMENIPEANQATKNKLAAIRETSKALINRLCDVQQERKVCFHEGSSKCYCKGGLVDCSGKKYVPNIAYAPRLPKESVCLIFTFNNVRSLSDSFFANVSNFRVLDLSSNRLEKISQKTFQIFTNLKYLILNDNTLSYNNLDLVLKNAPSMRLDIVGLGLENVPPDFFRAHSDISTSQIYMDFNFITQLDLREFSYLDSLEYLSLTNSSIKTITSASMERLKVFDLAHNNIVDFPDTCDTTAVHDKNTQTVIRTRELVIDHTLRGNDTNEPNYSLTQNTQRSSLFPVMTDLFMDYNFVQALPVPENLCLPALRSLHLKSNNISEISASAFTSLKSLKTLTLDKMKSGITKIGPAAFDIPHLTSLYLSKNKIPFASPDISPLTFRGCSKLEVLSIDHNKLTSVPDELFQQLLNNTPNLHSLYLSSCQLQNIPVKAFSQLTMLMRLYLYVNEIKEIPKGAFDDMASLQYLYLDQNLISTVPAEAFSPTTRFRLKTINLSKNHFICDCQLLWFQSWLRQAGAAQFMDVGSYRCSNKVDTLVQNYTLSRQACLFSHQTYVLFVVCLSILLVVIMLFALVYRNRWNIRLMLYERRAPRHDNLLLTQFRYDLFVLYCNDDADWVERRLIPTVETKWGLQACIHQRDFSVGGLILDNMVESMNSSRRILVVASSRFARSRWCNFELQLCQSHVITHDLPSLLVILLDKIESRDMSSAMLALYNTTCFLEWPAYPWERQDLVTFWSRLQTSLTPLVDDPLRTTTARQTEHVHHHASRGACQI